VPLGERRIVYATCDCANADSAGENAHWVSASCGETVSPAIPALERNAGSMRTRRHAKRRPVWRGLVFPEAARSPRDFRMIPLRGLRFAFLLGLASGISLIAGEVATTAAGYWEGTVTLPNRELEIRVELFSAAGAAGKGTIDIPLQGLRGFVLEPVKIEEGTVAFGLPGLPGEPRFAGKLASDAKTISGDFFQGANTFPFRLERKAKPAPTKLDETPANGVPGKGLAANWRGSIKPMAGMELRLALELTADPAGKLDGVLISLDQGSPRIPVSNISEKEGAVHFETASVNGSFDGKMSADGSEIAGDWTQMGRTTPLVLKRLPAASR
jgi:hypothetical protein